MLIRSAGLPVTGLDSQPEYLADVLRARELAVAALHQARIRLACFEQELDNDTGTPVGKAIVSSRRRLRKIQRAGLMLPQPVPAIFDSERPDLADALRQWNDALAGLAAVEKVLTEAYAKNLEQRYRWLQEIAANESLQRALLFSSHDLLHRLPGFIRTPADQFKKKERQIALSVWQYATRAMVKTSPFSRLTTVSIYNLDHPEPASPFDGLKSAVTPNVALLPVFHHVLLREPAFYRSLKITLNPSISQPQPGPNGQWTWLYFNGEQESFQHLKANPVTGLIAQVLVDAGRLLAFPALLATLSDAVDADREALEQYFFELIDTGFLEWELPVHGLEAGWCGSLYQYLGFLPAEPVIVETAALLQWLRTAARTLQFLPVEEAAAAQVETFRQLTDYFEKYGAPMPQIPVEHVFFEDVTQPATGDIPGTFAKQACAELSERISAEPFLRLPPLKSAVWAFARQQMQPGGQMNFLDFANEFLSHPPAVETGERYPNRPGKIGIVAQMFQENGVWRAVLNGLYPGGGKMYARWLHLFPEYVRDRVGDWLRADGAIAFPWQGWSNVNFQPLKTAVSVRVPENRIAGGKSVLLGDLSVRLDENGPVLTDGENILHMTDLGLEGPQTRPPVMQVLWQLGVPYVSIEVLWPDGRTRERVGDHWWHYPRIISGVWVLVRDGWEMDQSLVEHLVSLPEDDFFLKVRAEMTTIGLPARFFVRIQGQKPQYTDRDDALSMQLFQKMLAQAEGSCFLEELLPVQKDEGRTMEFIVEMYC
jgi:hypothetical protein